MYVMGLTVAGTRGIFFLWEGGVGGLKGIGKRRDLGHYAGSSSVPMLSLLSLGNSRGPDSLGWRK
jgi:hypothetical protein